MPASRPEEVMVSLHSPAIPGTAFDQLEAQRSATQAAREQLVDWLNEQTAEFEILPEPGARPAIPLFLIRTYVKSLVEKLLNETGRPRFIRGAEFRSQSRFSVPQPLED